MSSLRLRNPLQIRLLIFAPVYLLDTNHCSYIINSDPKVVAALQSRSESAIAISIITYGELLYMTEKSERKTQNLVAVQAFLASVDLYFIDEETAILYSQLKTAVFNQFAPKDKSKRRSTSAEDLGFSDHDLWIAATAMQHNLTVVSADSDFTRIQQVEQFSLESWL